MQKASNASEKPTISAATLALLAMTTALVATVIAPLATIAMTVTTATNSTKEMPRRRPNRIMARLPFPLLPFRLPFPPASLGHAWTVASRKTASRLTLSFNPNTVEIGASHSLLLS
jgi:hypothetical protein